MKLKYSIEINPAVAVLLILLALIGIDLAWTSKRRAQRSAAQPVARPAQAQPAEPPARPPSPFGSRKPPEPPTREPITPAQGQVIIERDEKPQRSPLSSRPPSQAARQRAQDKIDAMDAEVQQAGINGARAYVRQHQTT